MSVSPERPCQPVPFREPDDPLQFTYTADPLAAEFEEQMTTQVREYRGMGNISRSDQPDTPGVLDDAPDATALMLPGS